MLKKLTIYFLLLLMISIVIGSCGDDDDPEPPTPTNPTTPPDTTTLKIVVSQTQLSFSSDGGTQTVTITTEGTWTAEGDASWCKLKKDGSQLSITVEENSLSVSRTANITIIAIKGDKSNVQVITITQPGTNEVVNLSIDPTEWIFSVTGETLYATITNMPENANIQLSVEGGNGWLTVTREKMYLKGVATANDSNSPRYATVTLTLEGATPVTISVIQPSHRFVIYEDSIYMSAYPLTGLDSRKHMIQISTDLPSIDDITVTCDQNEWCHLKGFAYFEVNLDGEHLNTGYQIEIDDNATYYSRTATITFSKGNDVLARAYVFQEAYPRLGIVFPQGKTFPASGGTILVRVFCNLEWAFSTYDLTYEHGQWVKGEKVNSTTLRLTASPRQSGGSTRYETLQIGAGYQSQTFQLTDGEGTATEGYGYEEGTEWD